MQEVITFANMKGGVGKTTLCVHVGIGLLITGNNVLIIDNDPQFNASSMLIDPRTYIDQYVKGQYKSTHRLYELPTRTGHTSQLQLKASEFINYVYHSGEKHLAIIASSLELHDTLNSPAQKELLLDRFIQKHCQGFDYVLIDCPPTPSVLTRAAFAASSHVIIPVTPEHFATFGLPQFIGTLREFKEFQTDRHNVQVLGVVFTNVPNPLAQPNFDAIETVKLQLSKEVPPIKVFSAQLPQLKVFQRAAQKSKPVQTLRGIGTKGRSAASWAVRSIVNEMLVAIKLRRGSEGS